MTVSYKTFLHLTIGSYVQLNKIREHSYILTAGHLNQHQSNLKTSKKMAIKVKNNGQSLVSVQP